MPAGSRVSPPPPAARSKENAGQELRGDHPGPFGGRTTAAYAPELNPVEYMWGHLKTHEIANRTRPRLGN